MKVKVSLIFLSFHCNPPFVEIIARNTSSVDCLGQSTEPAHQLEGTLVHFSVHRGFWQISSHQLFLSDPLTFISLGLKSDDLATPKD